MLFVIFFLFGFNILSLSLNFVSLITMCLSVFLLGFILPGTLCCQNLVDYFLSYVWEVSSYHLFKYFLRFFLSLFSFWDPYSVNVGVFNVVPEVSLGCLNFFSFLHINNYLKCKWIKCTTETGLVDTKTGPVYMLSTRGPLLDLGTFTDSK